jgi:hypothetical protein
VSSRQDPIRERLPQSAQPLSAIAYVRRRERGGWPLCVEVGLGYRSQRWADMWPLAGRVLKTMTIIVDNAHRRRYPQTVLMTIVFNTGRAMRTPVVLVAAQGDSDRVAGTP